MSLEELERKHRGGHGIWIVSDFWLYYRSLWNPHRPLWRLVPDYINFRRYVGMTAWEYECK